MIGKFIGARIGQRIAGRNEGFKGALIGAAAPWLLRRAFTPLGSRRSAPMARRSSGTGGARAA